MLKTFKHVIRREVREEKDEGRVKVSYVIFVEYNSKPEIQNTNSGRKDAFVICKLKVKANEESHDVLVCSGSGFCMNYDDFSLSLVVYSVELHMYYPCNRVCELCTRC